jgi:hypothetical protein
MTVALNELFPCREEVPSDWQLAFDELVGAGRSPSVVCATIDYLREQATAQQEAAERWGVTTPAIRNVEAAVLARGPLYGPHKPSCQVCGEAVAKPAQHIRAEHGDGGGDR